METNQKCNACRKRRFEGEDETRCRIRPPLIGPQLQLSVALRGDCRWHPSPAPDGRNEGRLRLPLLLIDRDCRRRRCCPHQILCPPCFRKCVPAGGSARKQFLWLPRRDHAVQGVFRPCRRDRMSVWRSDGRQRRRHVDASEGWRRKTRFCQKNNVARTNEKEESNARSAGAKLTSNRPWSPQIHKALSNKYWPPAMNARRQETGTMLSRFFTSHHAMTLAACEARVAQKQPRSEGHLDGGRENQRHVHEDEDRAEALLARVVGRGGAGLADEGGERGEKLYERVEHPLGGVHRVFERLQDGQEGREADA
ncbi:unnamed protein product [Phaeothamnion confervicola]